MNNSFKIVVLIRVSNEPNKALLWPSQSDYDRVCPFQKVITENRFYEAWTERLLLSSKELCPLCQHRFNLVKNMSVSNVYSWKNIFNLGSGTFTTIISPKTIRCSVLQISRSTWLPKLRVKCRIKWGGILS